MKKWRKLKRNKYKKGYEDKNNRECPICGRCGGKHEVWCENQ